MTTTDVLRLPDDPIVAPVLEIVLAEESPAVAHHSIRSFFFARLLAQHEGLQIGHDVGERELFAACVLHDIGLTTRGNGDQRFEVDGADAAVAILESLGVAESERNLVWEAIALHSSPGIATRRGPLSYLTREGVGVDFGVRSEVVSEDQAIAIHDADPRLNMAKVLVDDIVAQAHANPAKAPRYTMVGEFVDERATKSITDMERMAAASRWGN